MINIFNNKYFVINKKCDIATIWLMMLFIFLLLFLNLSINYEYKNYDKYLGYIKNLDGLKLVVYVKEDEVSSINNYDLIVNGSKFNFEIESISDNVYVNDGLRYYEIVLNTQLAKNLLIENNVINLVFEKEYTTLFKEFKKGIKKWIN